MIRFVSTVSLLALLILVLYLPSAYPPERFVNQLRVEHELMIDFWGHGPAMRILSRMLDLQATAKEASPVPSLAAAPPPNAIDLAGTKQMSEVSARLFNNAYFRSIDTLLALATYRFSAFLEGLPFLLVFMAVALFDGCALRVIKSKEFLQHQPEIFAVHACAAIMIACATVIAFVLPVTLPPVVLCVVPLAFSVFASRAVANYHRRG